MLHQFLDYKFLFMPKTTKFPASPYPIAYNKPPVTPAPEKIGAHFNFWKEDWELGWDPTLIWHFPNIS